MKKLRNNKGFTMVELIVVVAVLTTITAVISPFFSNYIEKARRGTDRNAVWEVAHAAQTAYVTQKASKENNVDNEMYINISGNGVLSYSSVLSDSVNRDETLNESGIINASLEEETGKIISSDRYVCKSKLYKNSAIKVTIQDDGTAVLTALGENAEQYLGIQVDKVEAAGRTEDANTAKVRYEAYKYVQDNGKKAAAKRILQIQTQIWGESDLLKIAALELESLMLTEATTEQAVNKNGFSQKVADVKKAADDAKTLAETLTKNAADREEAYLKQTENADELEAHLNEYSQ